MKALISPKEIYTHTWISSWVWVSKPTENNPNAGYWDAVKSTIDNCQRVAEVEPQSFEVASPLFWVDCPDDCKADQWYFKDGAVYIKPTDVSEFADLPEYTALPTSIETLP